MAASARTALVFGGARSCDAWRLSRASRPRRANCRSAVLADGLSPPVWCESQGTPKSYRRESTVCEQGEERVKIEIPQASEDSAWLLFLTLMFVAAGSLAGLAIIIITLLPD